MMTLRKLYRPNSLPEILDSGLRWNNRVLLRSADWIERFLDSRGFKWAIWAVLVIAVMYFSPVIFMIFKR